MCGLAGLLSVPGRYGPVPEETARSMAELLVHRGPDDAGTWSDAESGVALAFRRLSIIDLSVAGHQPMQSAKGRFVVVFNGEIYNHGALRGSLLEAGYSFRGTSDTEVLANAFEAWGPEAAVPLFRGMFAFAAWDRQERTLTLGRDRLGIKPLYLCTTADGFAFASELRAFQALPGFDETLDEEALSIYLRSLFIPAPLTPFRSAKKVLPGTLVRLRQGQRPSTIVFWSLQEIAMAATASPRAIDPAEAIEEARRLISEAVRLRMYADVPVGAFLSGGIDSSTVVALMQEQSTNPVRTFTIGFGAQEGFDETGIAREVSDRLGTQHTTVPQDAAVLRDLIPELGKYVDEPLANPSILPTYLLSRVTRQDVVVALSGDGGDEVFAGYNRYRQGRRLIRLNRWIPLPIRRSAGELANRLPRWALERLVSTTLAGEGTLGRQQTWRERWEKVVRIAESSDDLAMYRSLLAVGCDPPPLRRRENGGVQAELRANGAFSGRWGDLVDRMMLHDQLEYLPDDLLAKVDRASMAVSLEVRVPLLDHHVVEFAWSLPAGVRHGHGETKWLLREIAARYLPRELMNRPKMGFTVPLSRWLRNDLRSWADDIVHSEESPVDATLDPIRVRGIWRAFLDGGDHLALGVWSLLVLKAWGQGWKVPASTNVR